MFSFAAATRLSRQNRTTTWREMHALIPYRACTSVSSQRTLHACRQGRAQKCLLAYTLPRLHFRFVATRLRACLMFSFAAATRLFRHVRTTTRREMYALIPSRARASASSQRAKHACLQSVRRTVCSHTLPRLHFRFVVTRVRGCLQNARASGYWKFGGVKRLACTRSHDCIPAT